MRRRVAITGMGLVTCLGSGVDQNWKELTNGHSGIRAINSFDPHRLVTKIAGEVRSDFDPDAHVSVKELRRLDRHQQIGLVAACQAVAASRSKDSTWGSLPLCSHNRLWNRGIGHHSGRVRGIKRKGSQENASLDDSDGGCEFAAWFGCDEIRI